MAGNGIHYTKLGDEFLPVGFRFRPTNEELVYYLQMKHEGKDYDVRQFIREINICDHEPRDLPELSLIKSDDQEWYFFSPYEKNSKSQTNRMTKEGFWKKTGGQKLVKTEDKRTVIGKKNILTFKQGRVRRSQDTDWVMHEYYFPQTNPNANQRDLVVCCVKKKSSENVGMDIEENFFAKAKDHMLAIPGNNDYHGLQYAFGANEPDEELEGLERIEGFDELELEGILNPVIVNRNQDVTTQVLPAQEVILQMPSECEPQFDSSHSRRQEGVMLYQTQAASSVNVVPKPQTDRFQVVTDEHSGTHRCQLVNDEHSGTHQGTSRPQRESRHSNALNVKNASSVDVDAELPQINSIRFAPDEYYNNERAHGTTYPTSALEALSKQKELKQQQTKKKEAAERQTAVDFPPKKTSITKSNKEAEVAQGNNAEKGLKQTQNATTTGNWKGYFISWETSPPLTSPPSVSLFNLVLGVIMFYILAWEAVSYGQWC